MIRAPLKFVRFVKNHAMIRSHDWFASIAATDVVGVNCGDGSSR